MRRMPAVLALEDGQVFFGEAAGAPVAEPGSCYGEVIFNTSLTGYQEVITDPSYAGQIVTMTYPHIGNYGMTPVDSQSRKIYASGLVVRSLSSIDSSWRSEGSFEEFLVEQGCPAITDVDTRRLTRHIRDRGAMTGVIVHGEVSEKEAVELAKAAPRLEGRDLVSGVVPETGYTVEPENTASIDVVALDFGMKRRIADCLAARGARVHVLPGTASAEEVLQHRPDAVFLSNGPGDPAAVKYGIATIRNLLGKVPIFGICLGHQLLGLALGGKTFKLPFGHHGGNHPVKDLRSGRVEITSQNHGFALDPASLKGSPLEGLPWKGRISARVSRLSSEDFGEIAITKINLNDGTIEGIECLDVPAFSVQYHPEAAPGPHDAVSIFDEFVSRVAGEWKHQSKV
jgi:carbamoyl-phosphate synthase small subunit